MQRKGLAIKLGFIGLLVCLIVSMLAFGCEQPTTTPTTKPTTPVATGPKTGGVLKIGYLKDAKNLGYPFTKGIAPDTLMASPCVECLVGWDQKGVPQPLLATAWKTDQATLSVTFTLRKGVKFHDNTDWNAEACKWNLEQYYITEKNKDINVKSVDIIDDYTVKVTLNAWDVDVLYKISRAGPYWGPMVSPTAVKANGKDWAFQNPVGTGPFKLVSWVRDSKLTYKKFDAYWDKGKPYLDGIEMVIIADPVVQVASLKGKDIDLLWDVPAQNAKELQTAGYAITGTDNLLSLFMLDGAHQDSPFYNIKVRQAVQYAIDSKAIADSVFFGQYAYTNQWAGSGGPEYNPNVKGYPFDPTKAKQLLADAGYANGFKTTIFTNSEADTVKAMTAVQAMLKVVGIDAQLDVMQEQKWAETMQINGWPNGMMYRTSVAGDVLISFGRHLHGTKGGYKANTAFLNHSEALDKLIDQAQVAPDLAAKNVLIQQMQKIIIDDTAMITPLFIKRTIAAITKTVHDDGFGVNYYLINTLSKAWKD